MIRLLTVVLALGITVFALRGEDTSTVDRDWVAEPISEQYGKFKSVTVHPCPSDKRLFAAYCVDEENWWGHMRIFKQAGDRVEWAASFPDEYIKERGHYVVSSRWTSFPMLENPVLELIESTHRGNGSLWLLELKGREFRVLLHTPVRGRFWNPDKEFGIPPYGEAEFEGSHLRVKYLRSKDDAVTVQLDGVLSITDMEGKKRPSCDFHQICTWNADKRVFVAQRPSKIKKTEGAPSDGGKPSN